MPVHAALLAWLAARQQVSDAPSKRSITGHIGLMRSIHSDLRDRWDTAKDIASTARRLRAEFSAVPPPLSQRLSAHVTSDAVNRGLGWDDWRDCLFTWITQPKALPPELLETLFLNRVVGHHTETGGTAGWYATVRHQAYDVFAHRHALWAET